MRYFLKLHYKGTKYHGWQKQPNAITVQAVLDDALSKFFRQEVLSVGSGRTDTGVHAKTQVVHIDIAHAFDTNRALYSLNGILPYDIVIDEIYAVKEGVHARFAPVSRAYQYYLSYQADAFSHGLFYHYKKPLDFDKMNEVAKVLFEYIDFESFSKVHTDVHTFNCKITEAYWREENGVYIFYIKADRFLRGMVRTIVGTLLEVGKGNLDIEGFENIILQKSRKVAGSAVPAQGLFLWEVNYPKDVRI